MSLGRNISLLFRQPAVTFPLPGRAGSERSVRGAERKQLAVMSHPAPRRESLALELSHPAPRRESLALELSHPAPRRESLALELSHPEPRRESLALELSHPEPRRESLALELSHPEPRRESLALELSHPAPRRESLALELSHPAPHRESLALELSHPAPRRESLALELSHPAPRRESLALELCCPICLELFSDPLALPCGHSYCRGCIEGAARAGARPAHLCPECRREYPGTDALRPNFQLRDIVEGCRAALGPAAGATGGAEPVLCEHCLGEGTPAVKSCLRCEVSLCARHLQRHLLRGPADRHALGEPQGRSGPECACRLHDGRAPECFCRSDRAFLCAACLTEGAHRGHDVTSLGTAEAELRQALQGREEEAQDRLREMDLLALRGAGDEAVFKAAGNKLGAKALALLGSIEEQVAGYRARLGALLEEEQRHLEERWQESLWEIGERRRIFREARRDAAAALRETDGRRFIRLFLETEPVLEAAAAIVSVPAAPMPAPLDVRKLSAAARTDHLRAEVGRLLQALADLLSPLELTFDPNTAHPGLLLSADLRTAKFSVGRGGAKQPHPDRFLTAPQVLCSQGFSSGEHAWVVEVGGATWSVGVAYRSVPRRGDHSRLGHNAASWRVQWKNGKLTACHASCNVALGEAALPPPSRVEVALDYEGGALSFHSVLGPRVHLHTFRAAFRETLYPAFSIHSSTPESWITLQS